MMRRVLTWAAVPLIVVQMGCAARQVPITPPPAPMAGNEADRAACEALLQAEAKAAKEAAARAAAARPSPGLGETLGVIPLFILSAPFIPAGVINFLLTEPFELIGEARSKARAHEADLNECLWPLAQAAWLGPDDPYVARIFTTLAGRLAAVGDLVRAETLYVRALAIEEDALGPEHPDVATTLDGYAALLRKTNRPAEAAELESRATAIRSHAPISQPVRPDRRG